MITKMKQKINLKKILTIFLVSFVFLFSLISGATLSSTTPNTITQSKNSSFIISLIGDGEWNIVQPTFPHNIEMLDDDGNKAVLQLTTSSVLTNINSSNQVRINVNTLSVESGFILGEKTSTLRIEAANASNSNEKITRDVSIKFAKTYCDDGAIGNNLEITRVSDEQLDNEDEWEWSPRDNIEIEVRVKNNHDDEIDAVVEYGLYDFRNDDFILEEEEDITIDDRDSEDVILNFKVPVKDLDEDNYRFYVKVYDDDEGQDTQCADSFNGNTFRTVDIERERNDVIIENIEIPETVSCGQTAIINMEVFNLGERDEDKVKVTISNTELGLKQEFVVNNLDKGESKDVNFNFLIPQNTKEGNYAIKTTLDFDYDDNDDEYDQTESISDQTLTLKGNCMFTANDIQILVDQASAIQSGGKAGEELVIKAALVNTGSRTATFTIKASGFESWAELNSIQPEIITMESATSKEILIYLDVKEDATGDNNFKISIESNGEKLKEQTVSVPIQESRRGFTGFTVGDNLITRDNWYLWALGLLNVILVILIIVIAVKVARK